MRSWKRQKKKLQLWCFHGWLKGEKITQRKAVGEFNLLTLFPSPALEHNWIFTTNWHPQRLQLASVGLGSRYKSLDLGSSRNNFVQTNLNWAWSPFWVARKLRNYHDHLTSYSWCEMFEIGECSHQKFESEKLEQEISHEKVCIISLSSDNLLINSRFGS